MTRVYKLEDAGQFFTDASEGLQKAARRGLLAAAIRTQQTIVTSIIPGSDPQPMDRGIYRAAWQAGPIPEGAAVWNDSPYAAMIEDGVRAENVKPGRAMIDALAEWVQRKGIARGPDARGVAFAIAKSMQKRGIFGPAGLGILRKAVLMIPGFIRDEVLREIARGVLK